MNTRLTQIKAEIQTADTQALAGVWNIGKLLTEARSLCPHGEWSQFVSAELGFSLSYAARLMRLYSEYREGLPEGLGVSSLLSTLSLEEGLRSQLAEVIRAAELKTAEAEVLIAKVKKEPAAVERAAARAADPAQVEALRAELRAEVEAEVKSKAAKGKPPVELAELEQINKDLQAQLDSAGKGRAKLEAEASEAVRLRSGLKSANSDLVKAREELAAVSDQLKDVKARPAEVKVREIPPADYADLKAEVESLRNLTVSELEANKQLIAELAAARAESTIQASPSALVQKLEAELAAAHLRITELESAILGALDYAGGPANAKASALHVLKQIGVEIRSRSAAQVRAA